MTDYYAGREAALARVLGAQRVVVDAAGIEVDGRRFEVVDDVIIAMPSERLPPRARSGRSVPAPVAPSTTFAPEVQSSFGDEWLQHGDILTEHRAEFDDYFDIVDLVSLHDATVVDLGCGAGRWASFVAPQCGTLVVVDFSDAIFVARRNLADNNNVIFVLADLLDLPFPDHTFDFAYCLGVLHHLPVSAIEACRRLAPLSERWLIYLYYALDNRPRYFRALLAAVTRARLALSRLRSPMVRNFVCWTIAIGVYVPLAWLGRAVRPLGLTRFVPLAETYAGKSVRRIRQDVFDRFFTTIEQRFTRSEILALRDTFAVVRISDGLPYWHFVCERTRPRVSPNLRSA